MEDVNDRQNTEGELWWEEGGMGVEVRGRGCGGMLEEQMHGRCEAVKGGEERGCGGVGKCMRGVRKWMGGVGGCAEEV